MILNLASDTYASSAGGVFGGDDGTGGYAPIGVATAPLGGTAALYWVHSNHLGVPLATTDAGGNAVTPSGYTQLAYPGQMKTLPDLWYNRHRDFDPTTGRYVQADPIGLAGGDNPYSYADGNALRFIDPEGLEAPCITLGVNCWGDPKDPTTANRERRAGYAMTTIAGAIGFAVIAKPVLKNCQFDGPSVRDQRVFGIRYKKKIPILRIDYAPYPGTNGQSRLHLHPGWAPKAHVPMDPRRLFD